MSTCPCLSGAKNPPTAEALMRSRYSAYVVHNIGYIMNTCLSNGKIAIDRRTACKRRV